MSSKKPLSYIFFIVLAILVLLVIFIVWLKPQTNPIDTEKQPALKPSKDAKLVALDTRGGVNDDPELHSNTKKTAYEKYANKNFQTGLERLPNSLKGSMVDGEIIIDENKQLVVTYGLRQLFDYFLSAMGEESADTIHARVEAYIKNRTPEPAASQAIQIYRSYVAYMQSVSSIKDEFGSLQMQATQSGDFDASLIKQRKAKLASLRKQFFSVETIRAFFTSEDDLENYALAMMDIENDVNMTAEQKYSAKQAYISRLPNNSANQAFQNYHQQQVNLAELIRRTEELQKNGATASELYHMRVQLVGEEAAKRLAKVDQEEADFEARFKQYQLKKQTIIAQFGDSSSESQKQITNIQQQLFNENERRRLAGYEMVSNAEQQKKNKN